jgi:hypothetical protein
MKNLLVATVLLAALSGCTYFRSQVAVFHQLPKDVSGTTYVMIPFKEQDGSLEHKAYEEAVRQELNAKGFREMTVDQAQVAVFLAYGIDSGKEVISSYPIIGQTGVSSSSTYGTVQSYGSYGTYSGTTTYTPNYGVVGTGVTSRTEYTRVVRRDIIDKQALAEGNINYTRERL